MVAVTGAGTGKTGPQLSARGAPERTPVQQGRGPGSCSRNCPGGGGSEALSAPPLPRHVIARGGERKPKAAGTPRQVGCGLGKGRDNKVEEDCACSQGLSCPAASGSTRKGLPGKEWGRGLKVLGGMSMGLAQLLGEVVGFPKTLLEKDADKRNTGRGSSLLPEAWAVLRWVWDGGRGLGMRDPVYPVFGYLGISQLSLSSKL